MKTFYKVLIVALVPIGASAIAGLIAQLLGCDAGTVKYYAGFYLGLAYVMCMYEVGFIKRGLNV